MNRFIKRIEEIRQKSKEENTNINMGIMALNALFEELTEEQQKAQIEKFIIILESLKNNKQVINEMSNFLQNAGFEEASKAIDCEYEL